MGTKEKLKAERQAERQHRMLIEQKRKKMLKHGGFAIIAILLIVGSTYDTIRVRKHQSDERSANNAENTAIRRSSDQETSKQDVNNDTMETSLKEIVVDEQRIANKEAIITTSKGEIVVELFADAAPKTVMNFIDLADSGFYNGTKFHRVVDGFVIQGGDPKSKNDDPAVGTGGPGYRFKDEINAQALGLSDEVIQRFEAAGYTYIAGLPSKPNIVGALAMANSGPDTNGSQFFIITDEDQPSLNGKHTVFGAVTSGLDIARQIEQGDEMSIRIQTKQ